MVKVIEKDEDETAMETVSREWLNSQGEDGGYEDGAEGAARDLFYGGCAAGTVSELIYYADTLKFYEEHRTEIGKLLGEMCESCGLSPAELLRDFDKDDPMATETNNQNLLAWFGFEESARRVCDRAGIEV
jgi:hypothetical protein